MYRLMRELHGQRFWKKARFSNLNKVSKKNPLSEILGKRIFHLITRCFYKLLRI